MSDGYKPIQFQWNKASLSSYVTSDCTTKCDASYGKLDSVLLNLKQQNIFKSFIKEISNV